MRAHWYKTRAFSFLLATVAAAIAAASYRLRVRGLVARERELARRVEEAMASVKVLRGLLPICSSYKNVRDDDGYWNQIEAYIREHSEAEFSHGMCPDCARRLYPDAWRRLESRRQAAASGATAEEAPGRPELPEPSGPARPV